MCRRLGLSVILLVVMLWDCHPAFAWNSAGHRIISNMAYDLLDDETRGKVVALIKESPRFEHEFLDKMPANIKSDSAAILDRWHFLQSSIWADLIRGNDDY